MNTLGPRLNRLPIAPVILGKYSERNDRTQLHSIPVQWQLAEIQPSGEEPFADWSHLCSHGLYPRCHSLTILFRI